jgi:ribonuclease HI
MSLTVYTDGSGTTGGPAGIAFVAISELGELYAEEALPLDNATNQQAEILAAAFALHKLPEGLDIKIVSDSEYLVKGWNEYLPMWRANGWRKKTGGEPKNLAHWRRLSQAVGRHKNVEFSWCRGHSGTAGNERADKLAGTAREVALYQSGQRDGP